MTDKEIIKALECCYTTGTSCEECPMYNFDECNDVLMAKYVRDFINRQQAEIQALTIRNAKLEAAIERLEHENILLHNDISTAQINNERLRKLLEEVDVNYNKCAKRFYNEGVKDFKHTVRTYFRLAFLRRKRYEKIFDEVECDLVKALPRKRWVNTDV